MRKFRNLRGHWIELDRLRDRHGTLRYYVRRPGCKSVPLPGLPGSAEFMAGYQSALGEEPVTRIQVAAQRTTPGTIADLTVRYFNSAIFQILAPETKRTRRNILDRFREQHGSKRAALLTREHLEKLIAAKAHTPSAARNFLNTIRAMMQFGVDTGFLTSNPAIGVKRIKIKTSGYRTWTEEDIATFVTKHPIGTRANLALSLMLYTAQRRSDIVRMGRQHIHDGTLRVRQQKTGVTLEIPIHPQLRTVIDATPSEHLTFLTTRSGKPFTAAGFTNWFREVCNEAGLPKGISAHGLRKAACRRLAEAGCSASVIAAISGHKSLNEVQRYTAAAQAALTGPTS